VGRGRFFVGLGGSGLLPPLLLLLLLLKPNDWRFLLRRQLVLLWRTARRAWCRTYSSGSERAGGGMAWPDAASRVVCLWREFDESIGQSQI
jgi:hypothetical protein